MANAQLRVIESSRVIVCQGTVTIEATPILFNSYIEVDSTCTSINIVGFDYSSGTWNGVTKTEVSIKGNSPNTFTLTISGGASVTVKTGSDLHVSALSVTASSKLVLEPNAVVAVEGTFLSLIDSSTLDIGYDATLTWLTASVTTIYNSVVDIAADATLTFNSMGQDTILDSNIISVSVGATITLNTGGNVYWLQSVSAVSPVISGAGKLIVGDGSATKTSLIVQKLLNPAITFTTSSLYQHQLGVATEITSGSTFEFGPFDKIVIGAPVTVDTGATVEFRGTIDSNPSSPPDVHTETSLPTSYWDIYGTVISSTTATVYMGDVTLRYPLGTINAGAAGTILFDSLIVYISSTSYYTPRCCSVVMGETLVANGMGMMGGNLIIDKDMILVLDTDTITLSAWTSVALVVKHGGILEVTGSQTLTLDSLTVNSGIFTGRADVVVTNAFIWTHETDLTIDTQLSGTGKITLQGVNNVINSFAYGATKMYLSRTIEVSGTLMLQTGGLWEVRDGDGLLIILPGGIVNLAASGPQSTYNPMAECPGGFCTFPPLNYSGHLVTVSNMVQTPIINQGLFSAIGVTGDVAFGYFSNTGGIVDTTTGARLLFTAFDVSTTENLFKTITRQAGTIIHFGPNVISDPASSMEIISQPSGSGLFEIDLYDPN